MKCANPTLADATPTARHCEKCAIFGVFALNTVVLFLDHLCVPAVANIKPALTSAFLFALLLRGFSRTKTTAHFGLVIKRWRVAMFCSCHLALILVTWILGRLGLLDTRFVALPIPLAVLKYLILLPTIVLLPAEAWYRFERLYRAEWMAAMIAILTFRPSRICALLWPRYSVLLARSIYALAAPFVSGLRYVGAEFPTLKGPALDTTITFACGGLLIVELFQWLFAIIAIVDWNRLRRGRTLVAYFMGICLLLLANVFRIALLVIAGNRFSADLVVSQHLPASWFVIAVALVIYVLLVYPWMLHEEQSRKYTTHGARRELSVVQ